MKLNEVVLDQKIRCYDNGKDKYDRYTVVYMDHGETVRTSFTPYKLYPAVGMSSKPFHPQGFCQHTSAQPGKWLGRRIEFNDLPEDCRRFVVRDLLEMARVMEELESV